jgi:hypothetical protein
MMGVHRISKAAAQDVGIDFGCGYVSVAEHRLQAPQIGSAFQKVRREAVPQHVRRQVLPQPHSFPVLLQQVPKNIVASWRCPICKE